MKKGKTIPCLNCGKETYYYPRSLKTKKKRGYFCSLNCSGYNLRGIPNKSTTKFKKGFTPWNYGKPVRLNPKGEFKKGVIPWNKGLKGFRAGAKNNNWKGGITPLNYKIRNSTEYKLWRSAVFKRDNYACTSCGDNKGGNLEAHHIKAFSTHMELRMDISNGKTLCTECHKETDNYAGRGLKRKHYNRKKACK